MNVKIDRYVVLALVLCSVIFVGEYLTYGSDIHEYSADAEWSGDEVGFIVSSSGSDVYSAILFDDGAQTPLNRLGVFVDPDYERYFYDALERSPVIYMDQEYYASQITTLLEVRSFEDTEVLGADGLGPYLESTMGVPGAGLLVTSYALPSDVYSGDPESPIMEWIRQGGKLYWLGSEIGRFYTDSDGLKEVPDNQHLFFGTECVNTGDTRYATHVVDNPFRDLLSLKNSDVRFGLDTSGIEGALSMGYCEGGYASISMVPCEAGEICVVSGGFSIEQMDDLAQVMASGVSCRTTVLDSVEGDVTRGEESGVFDLDDPVHKTLYIYIGGTYTKFGGAFHV